jgi:hypothetical protein
MKPRSNKTFAGAVTKIRSALGDERCAQVVERSPSLIRKWADPDHAAVPNVIQALALDLAYVEANHGKPPILELLADRIGQAMDKEQKVAVNIALAALSVQGVVGNLSEAIVRSLHSSNESGENLTPRERAHILGLIERLEKEIDAIEDTVEGDSDED